MSTGDLHAYHTVAEYAHGEGCGHEAVRHRDHIDYVHDGYYRALHDDHCDDHQEVVEYTAVEHTHGEGCGHEAVQHGDHVDYVHDGHCHVQHGDHYDEH